MIKVAFHNNTFSNVRVNEKCNKRRLLITIRVAVGV